MKCTERKRHPFGGSQCGTSPLVLLTHSGESHGWYTDDAWRQLSHFAEAKKDLLIAADAWERWYLGVIGPGTFFLQNEPYVTVPFRGHVLRARALLAGRDSAGAWKEILTARSILPAESDLATTFVPALMKAGRKQEADELYTTVTGALAVVVMEYPRCGWAHNALAWTAAVCRRDLERALEHASAAVQLEPDNPAYLDTLAEAHFQRGDTKRALELARRSIQLAPDNPYYRNQQKRFEAGDPSAPLPE